MEFLEPSQWPIVIVLGIPLVYFIAVKMIPSTDNLLAKASTYISIVLIAFLVMSIITLSYHVATGYVGLS